jgi:hypothetical protein
LIAELEDSEIDELRRQKRITEAAARRKKIELADEAREARWQLTRHQQWQTKTHYLGRSGMGLKTLGAMSLLTNIKTNQKYEDTTVGK